MSETTKNATSRREFLKNTGRIAAASALAGTAMPARPRRREQHDPGGPGRLRRPGHRRGGQRPVRQERPDQAGGHGRRLREPARRQLRAPARSGSPTRSTCPRIASSSASTATRRPWTASSRATWRSSPRRPAFRWVHFTYAIEKGLNVFMEKPVTVDGPTTRKMLELAEEADKKNLKVGVGLMVRHCRGRQELNERIETGEIGDIIAMRAYRMARPIGSLPRAASRRT